VSHGVSALLDEVAESGAILLRRGAELRLVGPGPFSPDLLGRIQQCRAELLTALTVADGPTPPAAESAPAPAPPYGFGRCFECGASLPSGVEIALCFPCHQRHDPQARDLVSELWHLDGRAHEAAILGERVVAAS